uniref:Uncharacterized protein n=1 Tax=Romanomermis culicivorax TaxID=13658 RepID=A0A915I9A2_ROMCU
MKFDHQIAETPALTLLYSLPNHYEWMNAVRGTMPNDINLIWEQNWIKRDRMFELELIEWANCLPYNEKDCSDNK